MSKHILSVDIETFSDIDIRKAGSYKYALSAAFDILLIAFAVDDDPVQIIDCTEAGGSIDDWMMDEFVELMQDEDYEIHAYNASFEYWCFHVWFTRKGLKPIPVSRFRCTMVHGLYCGYTAGLGVTGEVLGIPQDKKKLSIGSALIRKFCVPAKPTIKDPHRNRIYPHDEPEKWELFKTYCVNDVEAERAISKMLSCQPIPDSEQKLWELDIIQNSEGVLADMDLVHGALDLNRENTEALIDEARRITGLDNPNSVSQLLDWLKGNEVETDTLRKADVADLLKAGVPNDKVQRILEIRQQLGKTSCKKYDALVNCAGPDNRVRGMTQFYGANRTGRYSGRLFQPQNVPAGHLSDMALARELVKERDADTLKMLYGDSIPDTLSQLIRTALIPSPGKKFVIADYSAIECRVLAFLASQQEVLDTFIRGGDIYCATASSMFGVPVEKHGPNGHLRQKGKIATLACIAKGQMVLTHRGLKAIETVTTDDLVWDGEEWVEHEGVVCRGKRKVIKYDGLTATQEHLVYVNEGGRVAAYFFEEAAMLGVPLLKTADGASRASFNYAFSASKRKRDWTVKYSDKKVEVYDILNAGPRHRFTVSGCLVHNCGYGGNVGAMVAMGALKMGIAEEDLPDIVERWRDANPRIVELWSTVGSAVMNTLKTGNANYLPKGIVVRKETDPTTKQVRLTIQLPSGRKLFYAHPSIEPAPRNPKREEICYWQQNQMTRKWKKTFSWGGKLVENITQAVARDLLADTLTRLYAAGFTPRFHVHDEVIIEADADKADEALQLMLDIMATPPSWAEGLPLKGAGFVADFYQKD